MGSFSSRARKRGSAADSSKCGLQEELPAEPLEAAKDPRPAKAARSCRAVSRTSLSLLSAPGKPTARPIASSAGCPSRVRMKGPRLRAESEAASPDPEATPGTIPERTKAPGEVTRPRGTMTASIWRSCSAESPRRPPPQPPSGEAREVLEAGSPKGGRREEG